MALVQQTPSPVFEFTVEQVIEMGRYPHLRAISPLSRDDRRTVAEVMRRMEIEDLAERSMQTLSGGERQKVFLAAALVQEPRILLLDEPTTFLDYRHQEEIARLLRRLHRQEAMALVEVTHDLNRAALHADRLVGLAGGRVRFEGSPSEIMQSEKLHSLYGMEFRLVGHPETGMPMVVPHSPFQKCRIGEGGSR
jgi:iron complex transport system ATP-binding protein